jgi:hypothetical protein
VGGEPGITAPSPTREATMDPRDDPPREGPDVQPAELEGNEEWPRETGPADVEAGEEEDDPAALRAARG